MSRPATGTRVSIDEISVTGADAASAPRIGPAIERGLAQAAARGLDPVAARDIAIRLPHGASERQIAEAVIAALAGRRRGR